MKQEFHASRLILDVSGINANELKFPLLQSIKGRAFKNSSMFKRICSLKVLGKCKSAKLWSEMVKELSDGVTETQILQQQKFEINSHWRKLSMVWERYCNASPKPKLLSFSLFIFSFISQLIWVHLGWNFHRWLSIQKQANWCTIDPFSLKYCTSQHSYPVPLNLTGY